MNNFIDKTGDILHLGDLVEKDGIEYIFLFCVPQWRYGFLSTNHYGNLIKNNLKTEKNLFLEKYHIDIPNLDFYYTPLNQKKIKIL